MPTTLNPSQLTPLVFMGGILLFLILAIFSTAYRFSKLRNGDLADGVITGKELERDEGKFYYVTYDFSDEFGDRHSKRVEVTKKHFDALSQGQRIRVIYQHRRPDNSFIRDDEFGRSFFKGFKVMVGMAIVLAICAYGLYQSFQ
ncbi:MAG: DUF3592 domain-containing protein [Bauldia sp.]